jgi:hypothetical protein
MDFLGMGVLTSIAKILERIQSIIQPTFPTAATDHNQLELAALFVLKYTAKLYSDHTIDNPSLMILDKSFLQALDGRIDIIKNLMKSKDFDFIEESFDLYQSDFIDQSYGQTINPSKFLDLAYETTKDFLSIDPSHLKEKIDSLVLEIVRDIPGQCQQFER